MPLHCTKVLRISRACLYSCQLDKWASKNLKVFLPYQSYMELKVEKAPFSEKKMWHGLCLMECGCDFCLILYIKNEQMFRRNCIILDWKGKFIQFIIKRGLWALKLVSAGSRLRNFSATAWAISHGKGRMIQRMEPRMTENHPWAAALGPNQGTGAVGPDGFQGGSGLCASSLPLSPLEWDTLCLSHIGKFTVCLLSSQVFKLR